MSAAGVLGMWPRPIEYLTHAYNSCDRLFTETIDTRATIRRYRDGVLHRDNEPALVREYKTHTVYTCYCNGLMHRDDGPAIVVMVGPDQCSVGWCLDDVLYKTRREYLTANPRWRAVTDALVIGARDPASPFSLLDQAIIARIALTCFE